MQSFFIKKIPLEFRGFIFLKSLLVLIFMRVLKIFSIKPLDEII